MKYVAQQLRVVAVVTMAIPHVTQYANVTMCLMLRSNNTNAKQYSTTKKATHMESNKWSSCQVNFSNLTLLVVLNNDVLAEATQKIVKLSDIVNKSKSESSSKTEYKWSITGLNKIVQKNPYNNDTTTFLKWISTFGFFCLLNIKLLASNGETIS